MSSNDELKSLKTYIIYYFTYTNIAVKTAVYFNSV